MRCIDCKFFSENKSQCHAVIPLYGLGNRPVVESTDKACQSFASEVQAGDLTPAQKEQAVNLIRLSFIEGFVAGWDVGYKDENGEYTAKRLKSLAEINWESSKMFQSLEGVNKKGDSGQSSAVR